MTTYIYMQIFILFIETLMLITDTTIWYNVEYRRTMPLARRQDVNSLTDVILHKPETKSH